MPGNKKTGISRIQPTAPDAVPATTPAPSTEAAPAPEAGVNHAQQLADAKKQLDAATVNLLTSRVVLEEAKRAFGEAQTRQDGAAREHAAAMEKLADLTNAFLTSLGLSVHHNTSPSVEVPDEKKSPIKEHASNDAKSTLAGWAARVKTSGAEWRQSTQSRIPNLNRFLDTVYNGKTFPMSGRNLPVGEVRYVQRPSDDAWQLCFHDGCDQTCNFVHADDGRPLTIPISWIISITKGSKVTPESFDPSPRINKTKLQAVLWYLAALFLDLVRKHLSREDFVGYLNDRVTDLNGTGFHATIETMELAKTGGVRFDERLSLYMARFLAVMYRRN
jgi:hypothetical protein